MPRRRPASRIPLLPTVILALAFALGQPLQAQVITGTLVERDTDLPISTAMVILVDEAGARRTQTLSNDRGHFTLRPSSPGRYRVRVERIGLATFTSEPVVLEADQTLPLRLEVPSDPIRLVVIDVAVDRRCRARDTGGTVLAELWQEARKSLELAVWTEKRYGMLVRAQDFERTLDLVSLRVMDHQYRSWVGFSRNPYFAHDPEALARDGFVQHAGEEYLYLGLSAETILSEAFERTHCFAIRHPERGQPNDEIGLAFEPVPGHDRPDVQGVLWLNRESGELRRVEYTYTQHLHALPIPRESFGGLTEFRMLDNGALVIGNWWLRMPLFLVRVVPRRLLTGPSGSDTRAGTRQHLHSLGLAIREVGGTIRSARLGAVRLPGTGVVQGVVYDSLLGEPLRGAVVYVQDAHFETVTDSTGAFRLERLPPGEFRISFEHPFLDALGVAPRPVPILLVPGEQLRLDLATPSAMEVLSRRCEPGETRVIGFVRAREDGQPLAGVRVVAEWERDWRRDLGLVSDPNTVETLTDAAGSYALCGIMPGLELRLLAELDGAPTQHRKVDVARGEAARADFTLPLPRGR